MKKTLLAVLLVGAFTLVLTGCGKKGESSKVDNKGPRVVCTSEEKTDGIKVTDKITLKFDKDNYVKYQGRETTAKFDDKKTYDAYIKEAEESDTDVMEGVEFSLSKNAKEKSYTSTMIYTEKVMKELLKDASESDKELYKASTVIKEYETVGMDCEYIEVSKADLGIK
jgi:hypothetical protein